jgi:2-polyprenyl-6-methoxyphenol hydroxylase-like FAD-dependent oxidoreductase
VRQNSSAETTLRRTGREIHYPPEVVDVEEPYILLVHQGMVEDIFLKDLRLRGVEVIRSTPFLSYSQKKEANSIVEVECTDLKTGRTRPFKTQYLVGCDGAHSKVRKVMLGPVEHTQTSKSAWGVLDGKSFRRFELEKRH